MDPAEGSRVLRINLDGVIWCYQAVVPAMIARRSGSIGPGPLRPVVDADDLQRLHRSPHAAAYDPQKRVSADR